MKRNLYFNLFLNFLKFHFSIFSNSKIPKKINFKKSNPRNLCPLSNFFFANRKTTNACKNYPFVMNEPLERLRLWKDLCFKYVNYKLALTRLTKGPMEMMKI